MQNYHNHSQKAKNFLALNADNRKRNNEQIISGFISLHMKQDHEEY